MASFSENSKSTDIFRIECFDELRCQNTDIENDGVEDRETKERERGKWRGKNAESSVSLTFMYISFNSYPETNDSVLLISIFTSLWVSLLHVC